MKGLQKCIGLLVLIVVLVSLACGGASTPVEWQDVTNEEGGFAVSMPAGKVKEEKNDQSFVLITVEVNNVAFMVGYEDFNSAIKPDQVKTAFDRGTTKAVGQDGKLISSKDGKVGQYPSREIVLQKGKLVIHDKMILVDKRLYQLIAMGMEGDVEVLKDDVNKFWSSFELLKTPAKSSSTELEWQDVTNEKGGFAVSMPEGEVKEEKDGQLVTVAVELDNIVFMIMYADLDSAVEPAQVKRFFDNVSNGAVGKDGKLVSSKDGKVGQYPSREVVIQHVAHNKMILVNKRLYQLIVGGPEVSQDDVNKFWSSFELLETPAESSSTDTTCGAPLTKADDYIARAIMAFSANKYECAIADFTQAIKLDSKNGETYYNRGLVYFRSGMLEESIADYTQALKLNPKNGAAYYGRGNAYAKSDKPEKAIADYTETLKLDPKNVKAYYNRGNAYYRSGKLKEAIADYTEAIALDPKDTNFYYNRGVAYKQNGEKEKAIADFKKAVAINNDPGAAEELKKMGEKP